MPFVIVHHGRPPALLQGQARLGPIEGLDLRLLVDKLKLVHRLQRMIYRMCNALTHLLGAFQHALNKSMH